MSGFTISREDTDMLRSYVTAADHLQVTILTTSLACALLGSNHTFI